MANPQRGDGHIDIANDIVDAFCKKRISGQEWQILWVILRKTWGYVVKDENGNPRKDDQGLILKKKVDFISLSQFESLTGIGRRKCHSILKSLINKNIVKKVVTQKGDRQYINYGFKKNYEKWLVSPKKVTVTHIGDGLSPKKGTKVSPKKVPTKEKKETIQKKRDNAHFFEIFWNAYPKKTAKKKAREAFDRINPNQMLLDKILQAIETAKEGWDDPQFIPYPASWLNGVRWEDEEPEVKIGASDYETRKILEDMDERQRQGYRKD